MRARDKTDPKTVPKDDAAPRPPDDTILLQDLAPQRDVKGGGGKLLFGEQLLDGSGEPQEP